MAEQVELQPHAPPLIASFRAAATLLGAQVISTSLDGVQAILRDLESEAKTAVTAYSPEVARLRGRRKRTEAATADVWVSRGLLGVASTGSVAVAERDVELRLPAFLARRHVVLLPSDRMVATLHEAAPAMRRWIHEDRRYVTFVSGPSRTSDIEKILTVGAHGPAELVTILVDDWEPGDD